MMDDPFFAWLGGICWGMVIADPAVVAKIIWFVPALVLTVGHLLSRPSHSGKGGIGVE